MRKKTLLAPLVIVMMAFVLAAGGGRARAAVPPPPVAVPNVQAKAIATGGDTCVLTTAGGVECWGDNQSGEVGDGSYVWYRALPVKVLGLSSGVVGISVGAEHACAVTSTGGAECWGEDGAGQLGRYVPCTNPWAPYLVPCPYSDPNPGSALTQDVKAIAAGGSFTCAQMTRGTVECSGSDGRGQLGDGKTTDNLLPFPRQVPGLSGVTAITAGLVHACALVRPSQLLRATLVKCWGDGQSKPVLVPLKGVTAISAGGEDTCALASGALECWGDNEYGQLGNGSMFGSYPQPVSVSGLSSGVTSFATGGDHTCAVTSSGGVKCWGNNADGQLGIGSIGGTSDVPRDVSGLSSGVTAITASASTTCAVLTTGGVKCWGALGYDASTTPITSGTPTSIPGFGPPTAIHP